MANLIGRKDHDVARGDGAFDLYMANLVGGPADQVIPAIFSMDIFRLPANFMVVLYCCLHSMRIDGHSQVGVDLKPLSALALEGFRCRVRGGFIHLCRDSQIPTSWN